MCIRIPFTFSVSVLYIMYFVYPSTLSFNKKYHSLNINLYQHCTVHDMYYRVYKYNIDNIYYIIIYWDE